MAAGWGIAPTDLANLTDGDLTTVTGEGSTVKVAAGDIGTITWDLGSIMTVLFGGRLGIRTTASWIDVYAESSDDNIAWRTQGSENFIHAHNSNVEKVSDTYSVILTGRYIRLRAYVANAATGSFKGYEAMAWKLTV